MNMHIGDANTRQDCESDDVAGAVIAQMVRIVFRARFAAIKSVWRRAKMNLRSAPIAATYSFGRMMKAG